MYLSFNPLWSHKKILCCGGFGKSIFVFLIRLFFISWFLIMSGIVIGRRSSLIYWAGFWFMPGVSNSPPLLESFFCGQFNVLFQSIWHTHTKLRSQQRTRECNKEESFFFSPKEVKFIANRIKLRIVEKVFLPLLKRSAARVKRDRISCFFSFIEWILF